jgi:hypothetical protein
MILDANGLVVFEQCAFPGSIGDSCAETSRLVTLQSFLDKKVISDLSLFVTPQGIVRYPVRSALGTSPWGTSDTSSDQVAPLISALALSNPQLCHTVLQQIAANDFKTGNGQLVELGLLANMERAVKYWDQPICDLAILGQALIFCLPFAWNPNATLSPSTWFVSASTQTSGYLNFINCLAFARKKHWTFPCWLATKVVSSKKALKMVQAYFKPEPDVQWYLDLYVQALPKIWGD